MSRDLARKLATLMLEDSYSAWLKAWHIIRDILPVEVTAFSEADAFLGIDEFDCCLNNMLYDLEMELGNEGFNDLSLMDKRAELSHWVYSHFTDEEELNLVNFRRSEAESFWELGQIELAQTRFQQLIDLFPDYCAGYMGWAECCWQSDWSYLHGPNYKLAEQLYRKALASPNLDELEPEMELQSLLEEIAHPEKRDEIGKIRLARIAKRIEA